MIDAALERFLLSFLDPKTLFGMMFYGVVFLVAAAFFARAVGSLVNRALEHDKHGRIDRTTAVFSAQLVQVAIFVIALTLYAETVPILGKLGTALLAGVSIASIVVGLAAQPTLGNMIAGFTILLYRPFQLGDEIEVASPDGLQTGTIENLTLGYTIVKTRDNRRLVIPNSVMASQVTFNLTLHDTRKIVAVSILVDRAADLDKVRERLMAIAQSNPDVESIVETHVAALEAKGVRFEMRVWCGDSASARRAESSLLEQIKRDPDIPLKFE